MVHLVLGRLAAESISLRKTAKPQKTSNTLALRVTLISLQVQQVNGDLAEQMGNRIQQLTFQRVLVMQAGAMSCIMI
jgi:hypothetical protein